LIFSFRIIQRKRSSDMAVYGVQSKIYDMMFIPANQFKEMFITHNSCCAMNPEYNKDGYGSHCNDSIMQSYSVTHFRAGGMYYGEHKVPMQVLGIYYLTSLEHLIKSKIPKIKSFVARGDRDKLWDILEKIKKGTLKDEVSVLVLYGDGNNGKSTLMEIMEKIAPSAGRVPPEFFRRDWSFTGAQPLIKTINKDVVFVGEAETGKCDETIDNIQKWVRGRSGGVARILHSSDPITINPGVFIFATNTRPSVKVDQWRRMPMMLELPNHFKHDPDIPFEKIVDECVKNVKNVFEED
jgi:hypothetical protein